MCSEPNRAAFQAYCCIWFECKWAGFRIHCDGLDGWMDHLMDVDHLFESFRNEAWKVNSSGDDLMPSLMYASSKVLIHIAISIYLFPFQYGLFSLKLHAMRWAAVSHRKSIKDAANNCFLCFHSFRSFTRWYAIARSRWQNARMGKIYMPILSPPKLSGTLFLMASEYVDMDNALIFINIIITCSMVDGNGDVAMNWMNFMRNR